VGIEPEQPQFGSSIAIPPRITQLNSTNSEILRIIKSKTQSTTDSFHNLHTTRVMKTNNKHFIQACLIAAALTGLGTIVAPAAQAQVQGAYIGSGFAFGGSNAWTVEGRYPIGKAPVSARGSLNLSTGDGVTGAIAGTFDLPLGQDQGLYAGAGVYIADESSLLLRAGWERGIGDGVVYLGYDYLTQQSSGTIRAGFGVRFK
jgi:hypothetical protein